MTLERPSVERLRAYLVGNVSADEQVAIAAFLERHPEVISQLADAELQPDSLRADLRQPADAFAGEPQFWRGLEQALVQTFPRKHARHIESGELRQLRKASEFIDRRVRMASEWYYTTNGTKNGPVSSNELRILARDGTLAVTDLVWKDGMKDWQPASKVKGLFNSTSPAPGPPPIEVSQPGTPNIAAAAKVLLPIASQVGNVDHVERIASQPPQPSHPFAAEHKVVKSGAPILASLDILAVLRWAYRVAVALALVGVFLPWYTASSSFYAPIVGGGSSYYAAIAGTSTGWGLLSLLCLVAGVALRNYPKTDLGENS